MPESSDRSGNPRFYHLSRRIFCFVMSVITLSLIWPGYAFFASATPFIAGFPLSFAWVIGCTVAGFAALVGLYLSDHARNENRAD